MDVFIIFHQPFLISKFAKKFIDGNSTIDLQGSHMHLKRSHSHLVALVRYHKIEFGWDINTNTPAVTEITLREVIQDNQVLNNTVIIVNWLN